METFFVAVFIGSVMTGCLSVPLFLRAAHVFGILDRPNGGLKLHERPVAYLGGAAVFVAWLVPLLALHQYHDFPLVVPALYGLCILLMVGLIDDLKILSPLAKFAGQSVAVFFFLYAELHTKALFFAARDASGAVAWGAISALWMLTIINAFNLIDVMDGLAATTAFFAAGLFAAVACITGDTVITYISVALCGALIPFWWVNKPPARMYLGDAGALWIGGLLAVIPCAMHWGYRSTHGALATLTVLWVPLAELGGLVLLRTYRGIPFWLGSPDHFSLVLTRKKGWSKWAVLALVAFLVPVQAALAWFIVIGSLNIGSTFIILALAAATWILLLLIDRNKNEVKLP